MKANVIQKHKATQVCLSTRVKIQTFKQSKSKNMSSCSR